MTPIEVVERWFEAHAAGDLDAARALMADRAPVRTGDGHVLSGFDGLMAWYESRRSAEGPTFAYKVVDVLAGSAHAAAVIRLSTADRQWRQLAVYEVGDDRITAMAMYEDDASG